MQQILIIRLKKILRILAESLNKNPSDINVCLLDRPRHSEIISKLKKLNVNIKLISDGDVSGALLGNR